ncbi:MAG TPA: PDZ domain-containing protein, partial [Flavisolibacter sp.]|nr:PDZ domain-containing protein [Flavisolibacter sp.]
GYTLKKMAEDKAWIGNIRYNSNNNMLVVTSPTVRETPLYEAGVDIDDVIQQLDGKDVKQSADIETILAAHKPGDVIKIVFKHRNNQVEKDLTIKESPNLLIVPATNSDNLLDLQKSFRNEWIASHVKE